MGKKGLGLGALNRGTRLEGGMGGRKGTALKGLKRGEKKKSILLSVKK